MADSGVKHSPAPWEVVIIGGLAPSDRFGILDAQGKKVALLASCEENAECAEANARLTASAPLLFKALKDLVVNGNCSCWARGCGPCVPCMTSQAAARDVLATLEKP